MGAAGEATDKPQRGGYRPGAGRKPKYVTRGKVRAAWQIEAEEIIVGGLASALRALVEAAEKGDVSAAKWLAERSLGSLQQGALPLVEAAKLHDT